MSIYGVTATFIPSPSVEVSVAFSVFPSGKRRVTIRFASMRADLISLSAVL